MKEGILAGSTGKAIAQMPKGARPGTRGIPPTHPRNSQARMTTPSLHRRTQEGHEGPEHLVSPVALARHSVGTNVAVPSAQQGLVTD